jgi:hypothetical protein
MIKIFILILSIIYLLLFLFVKIRFKFWSIQPVFHIYKFWYFFLNPNIIDLNKPIINKYVNLKNTLFINFNELDDINSNKFIKLIQNNYLNEKEIKYTPESKNILPYFNNNTSLLTLYFDNQRENNTNKLENNTNKLENNTNKLENNTKLLGCLTSRQFKVFIDNKEFNTYYIDFLCIHNEYRNKGIASQVIQTHDFYQRNNTNIQTSLFKRETNINFIVPLVLYYTYCYKINNLVPNKTNYKIQTNNKIYQIKNNDQELISLLFNNCKNIFNCIIFPDISDLINLIDSSNLLIFYNKNENIPSSFYFFRETSTSYNNKKCIEFFSSINIRDTKIDFIENFFNILKMLTEKYEFILIENISHNVDIIENIIHNNDLEFVSPTAYYFYNYFITTRKTRDTLIIS